MDATMEVLRLVSSEGYSVDRVCGGDASPAAAVEESQQQLSRRGPIGWLNGAALPSKEVLLTLLWVLRVEERRLQIREQVKSSSSTPGTSGIPKTTGPTMSKTKYVLKISRKRHREEESRGTPVNRRRFQ
jgi:transcriptional activator HAC1